MEPSNLPIWKIMPDFVDALRRGKNVVITAPPGSGKTTQIPQTIADNNLSKGTILVVQPRRVAARAVSTRVADERDGEVGEEVGYIVRYDGKRSSNTKILFVTDGVLLRFLEKDSLLTGYGTIIFDEFHERRAITDIALGLVKAAQARRPSLRIIVMSATIETAHVAKYLDAYSLAAEGTAFPVDVQYLATQNHDDALMAIAPRVKELNRANVPGDVLVFLAGKEEIRRVQKSIEALKLLGVTVLPLHGELTRTAQDRAFKPVIGRKVILATNVAETSITIPGIRTVIDSGYERRAEFDPELGITRIMLEKISKASADQRAGRSGREARGLCIRLWDEQEHKLLIDRPAVEMQRTDLSSVVLTLASLGVTDPLTFDFLDPPSTERISKAVEFLVQLGAMTEDRALTPIGWDMLRLALPPRYARMVVESERCNCLKEVANIAALMSGRPIFRDERKDPNRHGNIVFARDDSSDFFSLLHMFHESWLNFRSEAWCEEHGVNVDALLEAVQLRRKVIRVALKRKSKWVRNAPMNRQAIRRCILSGLVDRVALQEHRGAYRLSNDLPCAKRETTVVTGTLLVAADVRLRPTGTNPSAPLQGVIGFVTRVDLHMLEQVAPHLLERIRIPIRLDPDACEFVVREVLRYQNLTLSSQELRVDIPEALRITAEQRQRARRSMWHRVDVLPGIGRRSHVLWSGEKIRVSSDNAGPHWASVIGTQNPVIIIRERIVPLPGTPEEDPIPPKLLERVKRNSSALGKLLGRSS